MQAFKATLLFACAALASAFALRPSAAVQDPTQPTEHHKQIAATVGEWIGTLTPIKDGATQEPIVANETVTAVGDFWTSSSFRCELMGQPYHGTGVFGYDVVKRRFVGTWADSMSSHLAVMEGQMDARFRLG